METLFETPLLPHMLAQWLERRDDEPCLELGGVVASYTDVRHQASRMIQAQRSVGLGQGSRVSVLSKNRPEVLSNIAASFINGCV